MKGIKCTQIQTREHSLGGGNTVSCANSCQSLVQVGFFVLSVLCRLLDSAAVCIALVVNATRWKVGGDGWNYRTTHDGEWWRQKGCHGDEGSACYISSLLHSGGGDLTGGWEDGRRRKRSAVLPVAVGHGILSLLLLEELCDGQQLFQHVLRRGNRNQMDLKEALLVLHMHTCDIAGL